MIARHDTGYFHYHQCISGWVVILAGVLIIAGIILAGQYFKRRR